MPMLAMVQASSVALSGRSRGVGQGSSRVHGSARCNEIDLISLNCMPFRALNPNIGICTISKEVVPL